MPRITIAALMLLLATAEVTAADPMRTTRLMLGSGLLHEAVRAQGLFVDELVRLELPDDGDMSLVITVRSMFPPGRIRERWLQNLSAQLSREELEAAENFYQSVPGLAFSTALRAAQTDSATATPSSPPPVLQSAVAAMEAPAREAVLRVRTSGAARWTARLLAGDDNYTLEAANNEALAEGVNGVVRNAELAALLTITPVHALGFADYATSSMGRRFHGKCTAALDLTLAELVTEHRGMVRRTLQRRRAAQAAAQRP